jgi:hypothetical protein
MRRRRFRFVGEYREGLEVDDIFTKDGQAWIVTPDRIIKPVAATPDPILDRIPLDGKPGERGADGRDGIAGPVGSPGPPGLSFAGEWRYRKQGYSVGQVVEHEGSSYVCRVDLTKREPSENSKHWGLLSKAGALEKHFYHSSHRMTRTETVVGGPEKVTAICDQDIAKGQVLYVSGDGHVSLAQANGRPQAFACGIATAAASAGQPVEYVIGGPVSCDNWLLTAAQPYYLSPTVPGGLQLACPANVGEFVVVLGFSATTAQLNVNIHWMLEHT